MQPPQPPFGGPPYGGPQPPYGGPQPPYGAPPPGPPGPPGWGPPPGPPRKPNNNAALIILACVGGLVLLVVGAVFWGVYSVDKAAGSAVPMPSTTHLVPAYSPPPLPSFTPYSPPPLPTFSPPPTYSPMFNPQPGDCVRNTGSYHHPRLSIAGCTPGHYRIIDRIDGTTDKNRCASTGYTYAVWYYSPRFVLCMRGL